MAYTRWYPFAVVSFWLAAMSWLVATKVLPVILVGSPPSYEAILDAQRQEAVVGWSVRWRDRSIGWAVSETVPVDEDLTEVRHLLHFDELPLSEMFPGIWTLFADRSQARPRLALEFETTMLFDPLKRLSSFQTRVRTPTLPDALVIIRGSVEKDTLHLNLQAGDFNYDTELGFRSDVLVSDSFSPQSVLPGLRDGQQWTVEVYSPFNLPNQVVQRRPLEVISAKVEGRQPIVFDGKTVLAWLVVYRGDPGGNGSSQNKPPRGRVWVAPDGTVLRQEARLMDSTIVLSRLSRREARKLADRAEEIRKARTSFIQNTNGPSP